MRDPLAARFRAAALPLLPTLALFSGACAGVDFSPASASTDGIRYYRPATYFLVKPDYQKAAASVTVFHGPDTCKVFAAKPWATFANNTTELHFDHGMLQKATTNSDTTAVPKAVTQAVAALAKEALKAAAEAAASSAGGAPALLKRKDMATDQPLPPVFLFVATRDGIWEIELPFDGSGGSRQPQDRIGCPEKCDRSGCRTGSKG